MSMSENLPEEVRQETFSIKSRKWILILLIISILAIGVLFSLILRPASDRQSSTVRDHSGIIYLNASPKIGENEVNLYTYDTSTNQLKSYLYQLPILDKEFVRFSGKVSKDAKTIAYFSSFIDYTSPFAMPYVQPLTLVLRDTSKNTDESYYAAFWNTPKMENQRFVSWSHDGDTISFNGMKPGTDSKNIQSWDIGIFDVNLGTTTTIIEGGYMPILSPDGKTVLMVRDDGIYAAKIKNPEDISLILPIKTGPVKTAVNMSLSLDGTMLVIANISERTINTYQIDWSKMTLDSKQVIKSEPNQVMAWPVFSPDANSIAFIQLDWLGEGGTAEKPRLAIYDLETKKREVVAELGEYRISTLMLTDWR